MAQNKKSVYHGTSFEAAASIRKERRFRPSEEDDDWLGSGVYFFRYRGHARSWTKGRGDVVTATLEYDDQELLDLDDPDQWEKLNRVMETVMGFLTGEGKIRLRSKNETRKRWCLSCNIYRDLHPEIGVISYTFPRRNPPPGPSGFPSNARQICVSKQELITDIE